MHLLQLPHCNITSIWWEWGGDPEDKGMEIYLANDPTHFLLMHNSWLNPARFTLVYSGIVTIHLLERNCFINTFFMEWY